MERTIGMDVHAARCALEVISEKGRRLGEFPAETNGQALVKVVRMISGHEHLVIEEALRRWEEEAAFRDRVRVWML